MIVLFFAAVLIVNTEAGSFMCSGPYVVIDDHGIPSASPTKDEPKRPCNLLDAEGTI